MISLLRLLFTIPLKALRSFMTPEAFPGLDPRAAAFEPVIDLPVVTVLNALPISLRSGSVPFMALKAALMSAMLRRLVVAPLLTRAEGLIVPTSATSEGFEVPPPGWLHSVTTKRNVTPMRTGKRRKADLI